VQAPQLSFVPIALAILGVLVAVVYVTWRKQELRLGDTMREALLWGGGFIVYAVFDYFILMR